MVRPFDYAKEFKTLDLNAIAKDLPRPDEGFAGLVASRFRSLRRLRIRMAWHSAGSYRITDGRGGAGAGQQRFAPLNSCLTTRTSIRRAVCYGRLSRNTAENLVADLIILAGQCRAESMGFKTFGFAAAASTFWEA